MTARRSNRWWAAVAGYATLVLIGAVIPSPPMAGVHWLDKLAHVCEYLVFAWLLQRAFRTRPTPVRSEPLVVWSLAFGYGVLMEGVQAFLPWRSVELADALANGIGAAVGVWIEQRHA